jgi:Tfp pilus assembly protein PilN
MAGNSKLTSQLSLLQSRPLTEANRTPRAVAPSKGELVQTKALRQVAQKLVTPWSGLLESLESAPNQAVALLSVEPSASRRSVRLTAEARTLPDMVAYLGALQRDSRLSSVVLISHQVQSQMPGAPVRFQIQAGWGGEQ